MPSGIGAVRLFGGLYICLISHRERHCRKGGFSHHDEYSYMYSTVRVWLLLLCIKLVLVAIIYIETLHCCDDPAFWTSMVL
jgi:hypothetical protein